MPFLDRSDAGDQLAAALKGCQLPRPIVLALPRGGVPVGLRVAFALDAPLDVFVVRKVGAPGRPEAGIGAVAEGGSVVVNHRALRALGLSTDDFARLVEVEQRELARRVELYRAGRRLPELAGRAVVVVDDGLATGVTAEAALRSLRGHDPDLVVLAAPVCAPATARRLRQLADQVVCVEEPVAFRAVGEFYQRFGQTSDREVLDLLAQASERAEAST